MLLLLFCCLLFCSRPTNGGISCKSGTVDLLMNGTSQNLSAIAQQLHNLPQVAVQARGACTLKLTTEGRCQVQSVHLSTENELHKIRNNTLFCKYSGCTATLDNIAMLFTKRLPVFDGDVLPVNDRWRCVRKKLFEYLLPNTRDLEEEVEKGVNRSAMEEELLRGYSGGRRKGLGVLKLRHLKSSKQFGTGFSDSVQDFIRLTSYILMGAVGLVFVAFVMVNTWHLHRTTSGHSH